MAEMNDVAHEAWMRANFNSRAGVRRSDYVLGFQEGAFEERLRLMSWVAENLPAINEYAGARSTEMLSWMFSTLGSVAVEPAGHRG